jgi:hypothetical protein
LRNSAKTFIDEYIELGLVGFKNFVMLGQVYDSWCKDNGYTEMGVRNFRQAVMKHPFVRKNIPNDEKIYMLEDKIPTQARFKYGLYYDDPEEEDIADEIVTQDILDLF